MRYQDNQSKNLREQYVNVEKYFSEFMTTVLRASCRVATEHKGDDVKY